MCNYYKAEWTASFLDREPETRKEKAINLAKQHGFAIRDLNINTSGLNFSIETEEEHNNKYIYINHKAGTTDVKIVLQQNNFWIENKNGDIYYDWVTGSYFTPYLTTVGLYNKNKELVMVARYPQPIQLKKDTRITFKIKHDF